MNESFKISILGKDWEVCIMTPKEDDRLNDTDGFADWTAHKIVIANRMSEGNLEYPYGYLLKVVRHELIHAFMRESVDLANALFPALIWKKYGLIGWQFNFINSTKPSKKPNKKFTISSLDRGLIRC